MGKEHIISVRQHTNHMENAFKFFNRIIISGLYLACRLLIARRRHLNQLAKHEMRVGD